MAAMQESPSEEVKARLRPIYDTLQVLLLRSGEASGQNAKLARVIELIETILGKLRCAAQQLDISPASAVAPLAPFSPAIVPAPASGPVDVVIFVCVPKSHPLPAAMEETEAVLKTVEAMGLRAVMQKEGSAEMLRRLLAEHRPRVLHFIGHADAVHAVTGEQTLGLTHEDGGLITMRPELILDTLTSVAARGYLEVIALNACKSEALAEPMARAGVSVVAWETVVADDPACAFAPPFYAALLKNTKDAASTPLRASLPSAVQQGVLAVRSRHRVNRDAKGVRSDAWKVANPMEKPQPVDGRAAVGVPTLLLAVPPDSLSFVPEVDSDRLIERRDEQRKVENALTEGGAGITSVRGKSAGVHGMGGVGKSMLAALVARSPRAHGLFCPDGVVWLDIGNDSSKTADAVLGQAIERLASLLKRDPPDPERDEWKGLSPRQKAKKQLEEMLWRRQVLVVADDVWDAEQALPLKAAVSQGSRLLITSRDGSVVTELGATLLPISLLQGDDALRLMASYAVKKSGEQWTLEEVKADTRAIEVAAKCGVGDGKAGGLPLALRAVGSQMRWGGGWSGVLKALSKAEKDIRLDREYHPHEEQYRALFGALLVGLDRLDGDVRERYLKLAIFMEDERIPIDMLGRYWQTSTSDVVETVQELEKLSLIVEGGVDAEYVRLHDLQREQLRREARGREAGWHAELLRNMGVVSVGLDCEPGQVDYWGGEAGSLRFVHHLRNASFGTLGDLGDLAAMERLDLKDCSGLTSLPLLDGLAALKELFVYDCSDLTSLPSLDGLAALKELYLIGCSGLTSLPSLDGLAALEKLDLSDWSGLTSLPSLDGLAALKVLDLERCSGLTSLPSLDGLAALKELRLERCWGLTSLPSLDWRRWNKCF